jgi:hypothetical protein
MTRTSRLLLGSAAATLFLSACSGNDVVSPSLSPAAARLSSGSSGGGGTAGGGGTSTGGGGGGGGGAKAACTNTLTVMGDATEALNGNTFSASYVLTACQSRTKVSMTATDLQTNAVVWNSVSDLAGTIAMWGLPYRLTTYRVDAQAVDFSTGAVVARGSTTISTLTALACTPSVHESATVGYYLTYAAVWAATDAQDCGIGGTVHLQITNLTTGNVEADYPAIGLSTMIDFEGAVVSYSTPYRVYAELKSYDGRVLATTTSDVVSSPLK